MARQLNTVRIIGGRWRGRKLRFPDATGLRPTPDRVRETLFNWLGQDLTGLRCLDLFAGSGALGFEAASRNAASVTLVERAREVADALTQSAQQLGAEQCRVLRRDALEFLADCAADGPGGGAFDVVFLDPPFGSDLLGRVLERLPGVVGSAALIYLESDVKPGNQAPWRVAKEGRAGAVYYALLERGNNEAGDLSRNL
jgi:16S rRNA (guanine966-N2)-methyltransferase